MFQLFLTDTQTCQSLWVGTSLGSVIQVTISVTLNSAEARATTPVVVSPSGMHYFIIHLLYVVIVVVQQNIKVFFIYEDTSLKLAILMYYDILRQISGPVIFKNIDIF